MLRYRLAGLITTLSLLVTITWLTALPDGNLKETDRLEATAHLFGRYIEAALGRGEPAHFPELEAQFPALESAAVLRGYSLAYHPDPQRIGTRLNPQNLQDKDLYDNFNKIKHLYRSTGENAALFHVHKSALRQPLAADLSLPLLENGELKGVISLTLSHMIPGSRVYPGVVVTAGLIMGLAGLFLLQEQHKNLFLYILAATVCMAMVFWPFPNDRRFSDADRQNLRAVQEHLEIMSPVPDAFQHAIRTDPQIAKLLGESGSGVMYTALPSGFRVLGPGLALLILWLFLSGRIRGTLKSLRDHTAAYLYIAPAMTGMIILVLVPLIYGVILAFMQVKNDRWEFVGLDNFIAILKNLHVTQPDNFYFTLGVTILWTFSNVFLHVAIGLSLALILNRPSLKFRRIYRLLLILPWAIPNYITALIWKGMFHRQFGAINALLEFLGFQGISWFNSFGPAFLANLTTNVWLGFPFMMVVSLGALQSIPGELYEAASMDGASRYQQFRHITLPLLKSALFPAVILGTIWTFNMFNIIYLVSGGAPDGATDILIVDAYRWAFQKYNYGYAAAYSLVIFAVLFLYSVITNRITRATEGAFD